MSDATLTDTAAASDPVLYRLAAARSALARQAPVVALDRTREACVLAPSLLAPIGVLYEVMAGHGAPEAALRALAWAGAAAPGNRSLLIAGLRRALALNDRRRALRFAADARRLHRGSAELMALAARARDRFGGDGETLARAAMVLSPRADDDAYLIVWRRRMMAKQHTAARRLIERWKVLEFGDRVYRCGCDTAFMTGDVDGFIRHLRDAMDRGHDLFDWQHRLTQLSGLLTSAWFSDARRARDLVVEIAGHPFFVAAHARAGAGRRATDSALAGVVDGLGHDNLRDGIRALLDGEMTTAMTSFARFAESGARLPESLRAVVPDGPDKGHPLWHVANPFFRIWAESATDEDAQENWRSNPVLANQPTGTAAERYAQWLTTPLEAREHLLDLVREIGGPSIRALDLGCGFGEWLRFLSDRADVPIDNLFGVDYHQSRVLATREMLADAATSGAKVAGDADDILTRNIQRRDLSREPGWADTGFQDIDLITMFVVTGVFEDDQLERVLAGLADLSPRYLLVTTVGRRWRLWHGRENEPEFFARNGFREVARHWLPEIAPPDPGMALMIPKRYWTNTSLHIYRAS